MNILTSGNRMVLLFPVLSVLLTAGCMQVDVLVEMHDKDGGATVRETITVTRKLQDVCPTEEKRKELLGFLSKKAAEKRTKRMGSGAVLSSHENRKLPDGSVRSIAVYTIPDLRKLRIPNPFVHAHPPGTGAAINCGLYKYRGKPTGQTWVSVGSLNRRAQYPGGIKRKAATPLERQVLREMQPVIIDMLSDFRVSIRLRVPTRFTYRYVRNLKAGPKTATLFSFSGRDMDTHGNGFLENEEILLAILQLDFDSHAILRYTSAFPHNSRTPVLRAHGHGLYGPNSFRILQTSWQKKKYFSKKKKLKEKEEGAGRKKK